MVKIHDICARVGREGDGRGGGVAVELWRGEKKRRAFGKGTE